MINVGEHWQTRDGQVVGIFKIIESKTQYPIIAIDDKRRLISYTGDGFYSHREFPNEKDLMYKI